MTSAFALFCLTSAVTWADAMPLGEREAKARSVSDLEAGYEKVRDLDPVVDSFGAKVTAPALTDTEVEAVTLESGCCAALALNTTGPLALRRLSRAKEPKQYFLDSKHSCGFVKQEKPSKPIITLRHSKTPSPNSVQILFPCLGL